MKKKEKYIYGGIIIILLILAMFVLPKIGLFSSFTTEFGWIPFGEVDDQFTNLEKTHSDSNSITHNSLYWEWTVSGLKSSNRPELSPMYASGGDRELLLLGTGASSGFGNTHSIRFNENLQNKHFRLNYEIKTNQAYLNIEGKVVGFGSGLIELKPSVLNKGESDLFVGGIKVKTIDTSNGYYLTLTMTAATVGDSTTSKVYLSNPRWKPLFDCFVDNDEVIVFDDFAPGSNFNIYDLTYTVQKFCANQPVVIRSLDDRGIAPDREDNQALSRLSNGGSLKVPSDEVYRVPYITKDQTGKLRCPSGEGFNPQTQECENIKSEGLPDDIKGYYSEQINIGTNEILLSYNYQKTSSYIGDLRISVSQPTFVCDCSQYPGRTSPDEAPNECWEITINGKKVKNKEDIELANGIKGKFILEGVGVYNGEKPSGTFNCEFTDDEDWVSKIKVKFDMDLLVFEGGYDFGDVKLNDDINARVVMVNQLGTGFNGGYKKRTITKLLDTIQEEFLEAEIKEDENTIDIPLGTSMHGWANVELISYIDIEGKKIFGNEKIIIKYEVISEGSPTPTLEWDLDGDGIASRTELSQFIIKWVNGLVDRTKLSQAILSWVEN